MITNEPLVGTEGITLNDFVDHAGVFDRVSYGEYLDLGGEPLVDPDDLPFIQELLAKEEIHGKTTWVIDYLPH